MRSYRNYMTLLLSAIFALSFLLGSSAHAQQQAPAAPAFKVTPLLKESLTGQPDREVIMVVLEWPPGGDTGRHTHPGDEYATILEGTLTLQKENAEAKTYSAGESYHNEAGVVHEAKNASNQTVKTISTFVVEKGKPLLQPVK
jgi:quercetin dioxygenase-like cupin family protein